MALVTKNFSDIITFTRASTATFFNSSGVLTSAGNNVPRFDYNPETLAARGLLIEEQRTNSIRNNTMQGAVAGTPGTVPTNWALAWTSLAQGLQYSIAGVGTEGGIAYIDVNVNGTFSGTPGATSATPAFEGNNVTAAAAGQTWTQSLYVKLVSGSLSNVEITQRISEVNSSGIAVASGTGSAITVTSGSLSGGRTTFTRTLTDATTAFVQPILRFVYAATQAYNFTLRIGLPQLEQGAFATSVIPTTTTALTRSADVASVNTLSPWYNATASTVYFEGTVATVSDSQNPYFWSISDNTKAFAAREQIAYTRNTSSAQTVGLVAAGGATNASVASSNTAVTANTVFKAAASYAANDVKVCVNGLTPATTASATLPTGLNTLKLGAPGWSGAPVANAFYIRRFTYYPRSFAGAELQSLTA